MSFYIIDNEEICFGEFLSQHTLVVGSFDIREGNPHYSVSVFDPNHSIIFKKTYNPQEIYQASNSTSSVNVVEELGSSGNSESINIEERVNNVEDNIRSEHSEFDNLIRFSFASYDDGEHEFCLTNLDTMTYKVKFLMKTGVEAKDYSVLTKKMELKDLARETFMIHTTSNFIKEDYAAISELELYKVYHSGRINSNVMIYGCITLSILVLVACFQYYSMKKFFKKKKII